MKIPVYNLTGTKTKEITLKKEIFSAKINSDIMAQAVRVYQSNQRQASAKTLTRSQVKRTTKKVYRQKGTGGARHGSRKAPIYVGGGIAHGPTGTQNFSLKMPKKMKKAALKSALSEKQKNKNIYIIDGFSAIKKPQTSKIAKFLKKLLKNKLRNIAILFEKDMENAKKSARNIPFLTLINSENINTYEIIRADTIIFSLESINKIQQNFK